jgi:hypothetical protein
MASYFRLFPVTLPQREVRLIGRLSDSDWSRCGRALRLDLTPGSYRDTSTPNAPDRRQCDILQLLTLARAWEVP